VKAARWVDGLAADNEALRRPPLGVCQDAAARRYDELREFSIIFPYVYSTTAVHQSFTPMQG
jgi:hypothetical protein